MGRLRALIVLAVGLLAMPWRLDVRTFWTYNLAAQDRASVLVRLRRDTLLGRIVADSFGAAGIQGAVIDVYSSRGKVEEKIARVFSDTSGSFSIAGLVPQAYRVVIRAIGYGKKEFEVRASDSGAPLLTVKLTPETLRLEDLDVGVPYRRVIGRVSCGKPGRRPNGVVSLVTQSLKYRSWARGSTALDSMGRFEIETIPAPVDWDIVLRRRGHTEVLARLSAIWGDRTDSLTFLVDC